MIYKFTAENFDLRLKGANLASKSDIANFLNKTHFDNKLVSFNRRINSNKTKHVLVENELKKLQIFNSSLFIGQSYFNTDGTQLYLIFQPIYKTITTFYGLKHTISDGNLKDCQMKNLNLLILQKKIFLKNWYGQIILE